MRKSTHERLDETLIFRLRLSCARRISSAHFDPAAGCVRYWRQCGCLLFCTRMRAIFSRDVDMTRAIHHRNDRKLLYILLTDVKVGRCNPERPGASARRIMTSRSCDIATWPVYLGVKQQRSTYRISKAPTGRGRCRRCRTCIDKGSIRLEINCFVRPGRYTLLLRCTKIAPRPDVSTRASRLPSSRCTRTLAVCQSTLVWLGAPRCRVCGVPYTIT